MSSEKLTNAITLFNELLKNGEVDINTNSKLYNFYTDNETFDYLVTISRTSNVTVQQINGILYLLPDIDSDLYGYSDKDIRSRLYSKNKPIDYYLFQYITLVILSKFYSSSGEEPKLLTHLSINDLINHITDSLSKTYELENVDDIEIEYSLNITALYNKWIGLLATDDETDTNLKTRRGVLKRNIIFLSNQNIIEYHAAEDIIKTTKKCDDIMKSYFLNYERKEQIDLFFKMQKGI